MLKIPSLPLDTQTQEVVSFCLRFHEKAGFFAVYEQKLAESWPAGRGKVKGLKTKAYEATEELYMQFFGCRKFADREVFFNAYSNYRNAETLP